MSDKQACSDDRTGAGAEEGPASGDTAGVTFGAVRSVELGEFLRSRRSRLRPADVGFPDGDRRRAPGLRREEVASIAGLAVSWLARLEQGRAQSVSAEVLGSLADALKLDDAERTHLFALAGLRADHRPAAPPLVSDSLRALLDSLNPNPAYLLDRAWNIVAWNDAEAALFSGLEGTPNLLDLVFTDPALSELMVDHAEEQARLVSQFRLHWTDWPDDPHLAAVVERLTATSPRFKKLWVAKDVAVFASTRRVFDHPVQGRIEYDHHRFGALDGSGLQLVVYTPAAPTVL